MDNNTQEETVVNNTQEETVVNTAQEETVVLQTSAKHLALASLPGFDDVPEETPEAPAKADDGIHIPESPSSDDNPTIEVAAEPAEDSDSTIGMSAAEMAAQVAMDDDMPPLSPMEVIEAGNAAVFGVPQAVEKPKKSLGRKVLIGFGIAVGVLAIIYVGVSVFFISHFLPHTTVNGDDVSLMSVSDLSNRVTRIGQNYAAHITGDGIDLTIPSQDIDFSYDGVAYGVEAQAQIPAWSWPVELNRDHTYVVNKAISFNQAKLEGIIDGAVAHVNEGSTPPTNATMKYNEGANTFEAVPQAFGTAVERDAVVAAVSEGVKTLQESITLSEPQLVQPSVTVDDQRLIDGIARANGMLATPVILRIANTDAHTIDPKLMASWLSMNADCNIVANFDAIKEWTEGPLSEQLDTTTSHRKYTRPDGAEIEVEGGTYGWTIDGEALANVLRDRLQAADTAPFDVPLKTEAARWAPGGQEWSNRYIDVDLSEQYVRMYDEGGALIWESPCVSGNPIYGGGTDSGVYYIYDKASPMVLVGLDYNHDGEPDYKTPVTYWMPFDGGEGLHDAGWRGAFGGSIYSYDGSHGCVNLPYYDAEQLYGLTQVGDPVIVHW